jgi:hypothetical protein
MAQPVELRLPVLDDAGRRRIEESVPAESLGGDRYRLLASPGLVEGLAAGDEIALAPDEPAGCRVLRRGGKLCLWVYVPDPPPEQTDARLSVAAVVLGGYLDGGNRGLRILTVPLSAGFQEVEAELDGAVRDLPGSSWSYGNVYDRDNRPLGWWNAQA